MRIGKDAQAHIRDLAELCSDGAGDQASRVLLASRDALLRRRWAQALRSAGHSVIEVTDGAQVLSTLADQDAPEQAGQPRVTLVVADVHMEGISGMWLLATLRTLGFAMPIVLLSETMGADMRAAAKRAGASLVLRKPLALRPLLDIASAISNALGRQQASLAPAAAAVI